MIKPTVGRVVWYRPAGSSPDSQPNAAIVTYVHSDHSVNLCVFDSSGKSIPQTSVPLVQEGETRAADAIPSSYCEWMPYQKGQAAKTEAAEKTALELGAAARAAGASEY